MTGDKSYQLLANYNAYGPNNSTIVDEILAHGDLDFQIPSSVPYKGTSLKGCTALHIALVHKDYETFQKLIKSGADFTVKNDRDASVLHLAVEYCMELSESRKFMDSVLSAHVKFNVSKNPHDGNGISHFHVACMMNRVDAVEMFLNNGASVDGAVNNSDSTRFSGYTALHFAAEYCCLKTVKILLDRGAEISVKHAYGLTPLHLLILQKMKILDWKTMGSRAPWGKFKAELETNGRIIDLFMEKWDAKSNESELSYFQVACTFEDTSRVVELLGKSVDLEHRVATNWPMWPGYTALHFAARCNPETVVLLLENGADFLAKDASGVTPLDLCLQRYEVEHLHRFVSLEPALQNNLFSAGTTSLTDAILAMKNEKTLSDFIDKIIDINIALESFLWSGYTLLHLATILPEKNKQFAMIGKFMHSDASDKVDNQYNCSKESETLYLDRIKLCLSKGSSIDIRDTHNSTPLHLAYKLLRASAVNYFLTNHESLGNAVDKDNLSHLYIACMMSNGSAVEKLLSKSADHVNFALPDKFYCTSHVDGQPVNFGKRTPLHAAVLSEKREIVMLLLTRDADRYARDADGLTPIHHTFVKGLRVNSNIQIFRQLANVLLFSDELRECETSFGLSHLHVASFANNVTAIEKLMINGANTEATICSTNVQSERLKIILKCVDGFTPLNSALKFDCKEAVVTLTRCRANFLAVPLKINYELHQKHSDFVARTLIKDLMAQKPIRDAFGLTQLHAACATLNVDRAKELLWQGADPNVQVKEDSPLWAGNTPLHFVYIKREEYPANKISSILKLLMKFGADVTLKNWNNETPVLSVFYLSTSGAFLFPSHMLKSQRDFTVNPVDNEGWSHFHLACFCNQTATVEKYIENGVNVNQPVDYLSRIFGGSRPIHITANRKCNETLGVLLKHGADVHVRNITGRTPFHEAVDFFHYRIRAIPFPIALDRTPYKSLLEAGADEKCLTHRGEYAVEIMLKSQTITSEVCPNYVEGNINLFNSLTDEGYIAMAISRELNANTLLDNLIYQALIKSPEKHLLDELGRTPIHNVVSTWQRRIPYEVYVKVIEQLDLNFDIDQQDLKGRTALHLATKFCNWRAVRVLLNFGSDVNIMDINRETPLSYLSKLYEKNRFVNLNEDDRSLISQILGHMFGLRCADIHISKTNEDINATLGKRFVYKSTKPWEGEVDLLKSKRIDDLELTLWDFLSETRAIPSYPSMRPWKRRAIDNFFKNDRTSLRKEFNMSAGLLQLQYRKAANRSALVKRAKNSLNLLVEYVLPDVCCDLVLLYLNQEELKILIETKILDEQLDGQNFSDVSQSVSPVIGVEPMKFFIVNKV